MFNLKLFLLSILALLFLLLGFIYTPWFILISIIIVLYNQRELLKNSHKNK